MHISLDNFISKQIIMLFCGVIFHYPIVQEVLTGKNTYLTFLSHWDAF